MEGVICHCEACKSFYDSRSGLCPCGRIAQLEAELARVKKLIHRDQTGLANAMNRIQAVFRGYGWLANFEEWGSYEWDERTMTNLRAEFARCFDEVEQIAKEALRASGDLANEAFGHPPKPMTLKEAIEKARGGPTPTPTPRQGFA